MPNLQSTCVGQSNSPLLIIDNAHPCASELVEDAGSIQRFQPSAGDHYPGVKCVTSELYRTWLTSLVNAQLTPSNTESVCSRLAIPRSQCLQVAQSTYALTTTPAAQLRPVQMLPHFDTAKPLVFAAVHYLSDTSLGYGGTSFYRHNHTQMERIEMSQLANYAACVKQEAQQDKRHLSPSYVNNSDQRFTQISRVDSQFNRLIVYPANLLHSGDILPIPVNNQTFCSTQTGRLTVTSLLVCCCVD